MRTANNQRFLGIKNVVSYSPTAQHITKKKGLWRN